MKTSLFAFILFIIGVVKGEEDIVGGHHAQKGEFPFQVSVRTTSHQCGGTILSSKYVLTAAHCVEGIQANKLSVRAGSLSSNSGGVIVPVSSVTIHAKYNADTIQNDIAVLLLNMNLQFGGEIAAVQLPSSEQDTLETGTDVEVIGWGATSSGGSSASQLQVANIKILDHETCVEDYADKQNVTDSMVCAGVREGGKDSCQGDSGGPLLEIATKKQYGIVSWGFGCGQAARAGVYTSTSAYLSWIQKNALLEG